MRLDRYDNGNYDRGRPWWFELLWIAVLTLFVRSWIPGSWHRCWLLRLFGAQIGRGVCIKPGVRVKFPWRLVVGDHVWIGEDVWIDNLAEVEIGSHCCLSQGAYLCTGSHDWSRESFDLVVKGIRVESHAWIAARSTVAPGVIVGEGAVLGLGSMASRNLDPWTVYSGVPARAVRARLVTSEWE